jgi:glycosyltransferase involved in cell wall biosynthesis
MLISAAIIVKNEEGIIRRCIETVSQFADEIVIVDTGSTDKTMEIAKGYPIVRLFESETYTKHTQIKDFSFSKAKNEAIRKCKGDWVIWWDADDFADKENADKIRRLAEETKETCLYTFSVVFGDVCFEHCRMFTNGAQIFFDEDHSCHEYLNTLGLAHYSRREVVINHLPGKKHVPSAKRNIAIMETDHFERGMNDQRTLFYLANAYREEGRLDDALKFYDKYLEVSHWKEERFFARYYKAQVLSQMKRWDESRKEAMESLTEDFRFAEPYCLLGDLAYREEDFDRAQLWYMMATATPFPENARLFTVRTMYDEYPSVRIRDCHSKLSGFNSFEEAIKKVTGDRVEDKEVLGHFRLPDNSEEAVMAATALACLGEYHGKQVGIRVPNRIVADIVESSYWLFVSTDADAKEISIPNTLNGRSRIEWYCRAAGTVLEDWSPINANADGVGDKIRRVLNAD